MTNVIILFVFYYVFGYVLLFNKKQLLSKNKHVHEILDNQINNIVILLDDRDHILWTNKACHDLGYELEGLPIHKLSPKLNVVVSNEQPQEIQIKDNYFLVQFFKKTRSLVMIDISKTQLLQHQLQDINKIIMLIDIDNYNNTLHRQLTNLNIISLEAAIKEFFTKLAEKYEALLITNTHLSYLFMFNKSQYELMHAKNFNFLEEFPNYINAKFQLYLFLSISIVYGLESTSLIDNFKIAKNNLKTVKLRGGNQIVIQSEQNLVTYFAGKQQVKVDFFNENLSTLIKTLQQEIGMAKNVIVTGHINADFDSLAACLIIDNICEMIGKPSFIVVDQSELDNATKHAFANLLSNDECLAKRVIHPDGVPKQSTANTLSIVVDVNQKDLIRIINSILKTDKIIVIDHHYKSINSIKSTFEYINPSISSTSELLVGLIEYQNWEKKMNKEIWNFALAGILIDTNRYQQNTNHDTFKASALLQNWGADIDVVNRWLTNDLDETLSMSEFILSNHEIINDNVLILMDARVNKQYSKVFIAKLANQFIMTNKIEAAFVLAYDADNNIIISGRSKHETEFNMQAILEQFDNLGGGSYNAGAVKIINEKDIKKVKRQLKTILAKVGSL